MKNSKEPEKKQEWSEVSVELQRRLVKFLGGFLVVRADSALQDLLYAKLH
ncbi:MAG: hypothetical protein KDE50_01355 [Caldilineaceae bacterium]|nr:hypothetical protein [Caldilineaceae bacterium]